MRRISSRWIARTLFCVSMTLALAWSTNAPAAPPACGDVDASGTVTAGDALAVLRIAVGQPTATACVEANGTYDGTYSGDDRGTLTVTVDGEGVFTGYTYSTIFDEWTGIDGTVDAEGNVSGTTAANGILTGFIDAAGNGSGSWHADGENGTWTISRRD